jgi:lysophospholipase L1-like esterase
MLGEVRAAGAQPVLVTYASSNHTYRTANATIRDVARMTQTLLIDVTPVFDARCPDEQCPALLFPDGHPTAAGYALVAEVVQGALGPLLPPR